VPPDLAESLLRQLIQSSLATQEQAGVAAQAHGSGKRALVIGGHGKMGGWFANFWRRRAFASPSPILGRPPGFRLRGGLGERPTGFRLDRAGHSLERHGGSAADPGNAQACAA
jgi:hypothetical protein